MKKIQRILAGALVLAMGVTMVTGCGSSKNDNNSNNDKKSTIDVSDISFVNNGVLTVGAEMSYPPFEDIADDGSTPIGFDVDIATEVADRLGLDVKFINTAWDGILPQSVRIMIVYVLLLQ